jgi:allantoinase
LLAGGGTVFVDMPLNSVPVTTTKAALSAKLERMRQSHADYALWGGLTPDSLPHLEALAEGGVIGFKAFMSHSGLPEFARANEDTLLLGMRQAAQLGLPVAVHAESDSLTQRPRAATTTDIRAYLDSRPIEAELEAIAQALAMAQETGCKLHIVHISSAAGVELVSAAKQRGVDVSAETCPHYLWFSEDDLLALGAVLKCAPPVRHISQLERLWAVLEQIDIIGSDHSPAPPLKTSSNFFEVWGGISGVQSTLEVMLTATQARGMALGGVLPKLSANPAARFGLSGKGKLEVGYDADVVLVESTPYRLEATDLQYRHAQSPYLGAALTSRVRHTILRGQTVWDGVNFAPAQGQWLLPKF